MIPIPKKVKESLAKQSGVVGINFRNRFLVDSLKQRNLISIANDKVLTKTYLEENGIASPKALAVISRNIEVEDAYDQLADRGLPFVLKPAKSRKGRGVVLYDGIDENGATDVNGEHVEKEDFFFFIQQILQGEYSYGRPLDGVLIEERIETDKAWIMKDLPGAPDIRIVSVKGRPVLAMARIPTSLSDGRANLHCGAVGVGIDLETHRTFGGVFHDKLLSSHPDTDELLADHPVPDFDLCLELNKQCYDAVPLDLLGVDLMRDTQQGPVVIELNARPGLAIQIANQKGLLKTG